MSLKKRGEKRSHSDNKDESKKKKSKEKEEKITLVCTSRGDDGVTNTLFACSDYKSACDKLVNIGIGYEDPFSILVAYAHDLFSTPISCVECKTDILSGVTTSHEPIECILNRIYESLCSTCNSSKPIYSSLKDVKTEILGRDHKTLCVELIESLSSGFTRFVLQEVV